MKELKKDQLYLLLRDRILSEELPHGFRFPPEGEYCRELKVGRVTLRSALEQLQRDRLIKRIPRRGTFVNLPPRKEKCILIVHSINLSAWNPAYWILAGMENKIASHGIATERCFIETLWYDTGMRMLPRLKARDYRGAILIGSNMRNGEPDIEMLKALNIPVVMVHGLERDKELGFPLICTDYSAVVRSALGYLAGKGHRKVVLAALFDNEFRGFKVDQLKDLLDEYKFDTDGRFFFSVEHTPVEKLIPELLENSPTAVLCHSDYIAGQLVMQLPCHGVDVPGDISIMGISGYETGATLEPPLTTVDLEYDAVGEQAVDLLLKADEWYKTGESVPLELSDFHIVERESVRSLK